MSVTKILIAEDDPIARCILETTLRKHNYDVISVTDGKVAWQCLLKDDSPRLAILDWMMPGMDGVEICRALRAASNQPYVYVLMLTAKGRREDVIEGLEAGADDYLVKPFDHYELHARLTVGKRILDLQNRYLKVCDDLRMQAARDSLTNLWNHAAIFDRLEQEIVRAQRQGQPLGVLMADLDFFKRINDSYGHATGDEVLRKVASVYQNMTRPYDAVGRYGGEEFMFVLPGCDRDATVGLAERLRLEVANLLFDHDLRVTVSVGATALKILYPISASALVRLADEALYEAKHNGRNRVEFKACQSPADSDNRANPASSPMLAFS
jgi:diguanylate cyclase (GGDEF)-like protein